jgi:hypothetical protein
VAGNTAVVDVAEPPLAFVTTRYVGVAPGEPSVQAAVIDVAETTVVEQVPFAGLKLATAPVWKPVPTTVNVDVDAAFPVGGVTEVIVGAAWMTRPAGAAAVAFVVPPLVFVMVKPSMVFTSPVATAIVAVS